LDANGLNPVVTVFDQNGVIVNADVVLNAPGNYLIQVPNAAAGSTYYLKVAAAPNAGAHNTGAYALGVNFSATPLVLPQMGTKTISSPTSGVARDVYKLTVPESADVTFTLSASAPAATGVAVAVRMRVYDQNGNVVLTIDALNGQTTSAKVLLAHGTYTVVFTAATQDGSALPALSYLLRGKTVTDPLDPVPVDPNAPPPPDPTLTSGGDAPTDPTGN